MAKISDVGCLTLSLDILAQFTL